MAGAIGQFHTLIACNQWCSPPPHWPSIASIGASRDDIMPGEGEQCEQQRTDANRRDQKTPRHVVDNHHKRINPGRWVKCASQMHCDHCQTDGYRRGPRSRSAHLYDEQSNKRGNEMAADQRTRLSRFCFGRAQHHNDRSREWNCHQRKCGADREYLHARDRNGAAGRSSEDGNKLGSIEHPDRTMQRL
jgi:hypothetical protein